MYEEDKARQRWKASAKKLFRERNLARWQRDGLFDELGTNDRILARGERAITNVRETLERERVRRIDAERALKKVAAELGQAHEGEQAVAFNLESSDHAANRLDDKLAAIAADWTKRADYCQRDCPEPDQLSPLTNRQTCNIRGGTLRECRDDLLQALGMKDGPASASAGHPIADKAKGLLKAMSFAFRADGTKDHDGSS